jgi:hypothetical protein
MPLHLFRDVLYQIKNFFIICKFTQAQNKKLPPLIVNWVEYTVKVMAILRKKKKNLINT